MTFSLYTKLSAAIPGEEKADYNPTIAAASNEGKRAIAGFRIPEFLTPRLVAAEPDLANPVAFCIDRHGRFYVAETFRQQKGVEDNRYHMDWLLDDLAAQTVEDRVAYFRKHLGEKVYDYTKEQDRIRLLEDTNNDGVLDRATVYADGFNEIEDGTGAGLLANNGDVYYTCIPKLYKLRDTNGDGVADTSEVLHDGYGVRVAFRGHDMHGLTMGPDGRLYFSIGDRGFNVLNQEGIRLKYPDRGAVFRCEPDGSHLEVFAYGLRNPQELAFDNFGNLFTGDNNSDSGDQARWVYVVQDGDTGWRMYFQYLSDRGPWNRERMWYPHKADEETEKVQPAYIVPPIANLGDGPSGLTYYPGVGLPDRYENHFFLADFRGSSANSGIRSFSVKPKGASFELTDSHEFLWSILATDVDFGYDGALYLTDWVNGWEGPGKGRIYQFTSKDDAQGAADVAALFREGFHMLSPERLTQLLSHADRRVRQAVQFELVDRIGAKKLPADLLFDLVKSDQPRMTRVHGIWGLGQLLRAGLLDNRQMATLNELLDDQDAEIRAQSARVLGDAVQNPILDGLRETIRHDESPRVKHLAALSFGRVYPLAQVNANQATSDVRLVLGMLEANESDDPVVRHSAVMALVGIGKVHPLMLSQAADGATDVERLGLLLALRRLHDPAVKRFLNDPNPELILAAARAINDEPMEELTVDLAKLVRRTDLYGYDPLMRRAIHSAFRVGTGELAEAVALIAASDSVSPDVRLFAAEALVDWNDPGPLDRVNGAWRPVDRDPLENIAQHLQPHLAGMLSADRKLRAIGIELAANYGLKDVNPLLWSLFKNEEEPVANRVAALSALDALGADALDEGVQAALDSEVPELRATARTILVKQDRASAFPYLLEGVAIGTTLEKQQALDALDAMHVKPADDVLADLMKLLIDGRLPAEIQLDVLEAALKRKQEPFAELVEVYQTQLAGKNDPLAKYHVALKGGDTQRGYDIFFGRSDASCRRCHKVNGSGGDVGPDLSKIGADKDRQYLLEAIVNPNAKIAKGFETAILVTDAGKVITGIVKEETDDALTVMLNDGTPVRVNKDEIEERAPGRSGMPDDLIKQLSLSDVRDLVEYLSSLKTADEGTQAHE